MTTAERAQAVADALTKVPGAPAATADELLAPLAAELGHAEALDRFCPIAGARRHATPLAPLLHLVGDASAYSGLHSVARGILLGTRNLVASAQPVLLEPFLGALPPELAATVELRNEPPAAWLSAAAAIAFESSDRCSAIRGQLRPGSPFEPNPPSPAAAIILDDPGQDAPALAAADLAVTLVHGEPTFHNLYVAPAVATPSEFAARLAEELAQHPVPAKHPLPTPVADLRASYRFRSQSDQTVSVHDVGEPPHFTVLAENDPLFATPPGTGAVFVKPLPADLDSALRFVRSEMHTLAVHPFEDPAIAVSLRLGIARVRPLGTNRFPSPLRARPLYSPWVRWTVLG